MAVQVFTDADVTINAIDFSSYTKSVSMNLSNDVPETTAMGVGTRTRIVGLKDWTVEVTLNDDWDDDQVDEEIWDIYNGAVAVEIIIKPKSDAGSTSNPVYTGTGVLEGFSPVSGTVGDVAEKSITFQAAGPMVRATAD